MQVKGKYSGSRKMSPNWMKEQRSEKNNQHFRNELHFFETFYIFISVACVTYKRAVIFMRGTIDTIMCSF